MRRPKNVRTLLPKRTTHICTFATPNVHNLNSKFAILTTRTKRAHTRFSSADPTRNQSRLTTRSLAPAKRTAESNKLRISNPPLATRCGANPWLQPTPQANPLVKLSLPSTPVSSHKNLSTAYRTCYSTQPSTWPNLAASGSPQPSLSVHYDSTDKSTRSQTA